MYQQIWAGVSPSLPIPKLTQYIQFVKSGQKIWAGPSPPLNWTKSKRTATFFGKPSVSGWSELDFSVGLLISSFYQLQIEDSPMFDRHVGCQTFKPSQVCMKTRGLLINASASSVDQRRQLWGKGGMLLVSNGLIHVIINLSKLRHKIGPMFATKSSSFSMWARAWSKLSRGNSSSTSYWCQPTKLKR